MVSDPALLLSWRGIVSAVTRNNNIETNAYLEWYILFSNRSICTFCIVTVLEEFYACIITICLLYLLYLLAFSRPWSVRLPSRNTVHMLSSFNFPRREAARGLPFRKWNVQRSNLKIEVVSSSIWASFYSWVGVVVLEGWEVHLESSLTLESTLRVRSSTRVNDVS